MIDISFAVPGPPIPKGSMTAQIVGRRIKIGGATAVVQPRAILIDTQNMSRRSTVTGKVTRKSGGLDRWSQRVAECSRVYCSGPPSALDFEFSAEFVLPRPPSHWTKTGKVRKGKPTRPRKPDISKLIRAIEDALTGVVWLDDLQIQEYGVVSKRYANQPGKVGGVFIRVRELHDQETADELGAA